MTDLSGLQPPLGRKFQILRKGGALRRALHPAFSFAPVALAGVLLAGSLAQTGLAVLRDTARPSMAETELLAQTLEAAPRDLPESRIRLKKFEGATGPHGDGDLSDFVQHLRAH